MDYFDAEGFLIDPCGLPPPKVNPLPTHKQMAALKARILELEAQIKDPYPPGHMGEHCLEQRDQIAHLQATLRRSCADDRNDPEHGGCHAYHEMERHYREALEWIANARDTEESRVARIALRHGGE